MFNMQYLYNCQVILFNYDSAKLSMFGTCNISHRYITYIYFQITITLAPSTLATYSCTIGTTTIYRGTISPPILMKYYLSSTLRHPQKQSNSTQIVLWGKIKYYFSTLKYEQGTSLERSCSQLSIGIFVAPNNRYTPPI